MTDYIPLGPEYIRTFFDSKGVPLNTAKCPSCHRSQRFDQSSAGQGARTAFDGHCGHHFSVPLPAK